VVMGTESSPTRTPLTDIANQLSAHTSALKVLVFGATVAAAGAIVTVVGAGVSTLAAVIVVVGNAIAFVVVGDAGLGVALAFEFFFALAGLLAAALVAASFNAGLTEVLGEVSVAAEANAGERSKSADRAAAVAVNQR
jgi:hypothetical protein